MHDVRYDPVAGQMRLRMTGFWAMADVQRFAADLLATIGRIPETRRDFDVLSDARDFPVQAQDVSDALAGIINFADRMNETGRRAIVVGSMMNKLQAQRGVTRANVRVFLSEDEAEAWLATPRGDPA